MVDKGGSAPLKRSYKFKKVGWTPFNGKPERK